MTKRERLINAAQGKPVDKVPVGFWHHFDKSVPLEKMVEFHMDWYRDAGLDFIKAMCDGYFSYPNPYIDEVTCPEDWYNLKPLGEEHPFIRGQVERAKAIVKAVNQEACVFYNTFCPMSLMRFGAGEEVLMSHMRANPEAVSHAFSVITEDIKSLIRLLIKEAGCDGVYFCVQNAEMFRFTYEEYRKWVAPYEIDILNYANSLSEINMLHCCGYAGDKNMIEVWKDYPAAVVNWAVYVENMKLGEGKKFFDKCNCVLGGFDNRQDGLLYTGTKEEIEQEVERVLAEAGTTGVIIGADCTLPRNTSPERVRWISDKLKAMAEK